MNTIIIYIKQFVKEQDARIFAAISFFISICIFFNYYFHLDDGIRKNNLLIKLCLWLVVFAVAFVIPYLIISYFKPSNLLRHTVFIFLLFIAPLIFALKLTLDFNIRFSSDYNLNNYWQHVIYWPGLLLITLFIVYLIWLRLDKGRQPFYGFSSKGINWKPYWLLLLLMIPLIALASTQADFLAVYPKMQAVTGAQYEIGFSWWQKILFEISYGIDFINIEFFFRGFLVLAFLKWAGKDCILPMACFYCAIHFGKPLGECISSYFGGIILGVIVYHTRSIYGGLMVHLGIAWLMELGGFIGNTFIK
ncbi:MAG TPA: hypothetical protein PK275_03465 [Chitinophagaceae bacterium]|nr:hypothetical protein [Chitinophagaceae bacterium]